MDLLTTINICFTLILLWLYKNKIRTEKEVEGISLTNYLFQLILESEKEIEGNQPLKVIFKSLLRTEKGVTSAIFKSLKVDKDELLKKLEETNFSNKGYFEVLNLAKEEAEALNYKRVGTEHLLLSVLKLKPEFFEGIDYAKVKKIIEEAIGV